MGFEYGFSQVEPNALVMWEAQFGDFANGAQVVIDQFISSGEAKWLRMNALVLLLPHGYEGQGPEHSSARLERYLQLCAEDNMQVVNCTTPANYFHVLRRQLRRDFRKPLVIMTPKSLLRHKSCVSSLADMGPGTTFHRILDERDTKVKSGKAKRIIMCSGKVYYDLAAARDEAEMWDTEIIRLEQLYPFPTKALIEVLEQTPKATMVWCQEEPRNMGGWTFVRDFIEDAMQTAGWRNSALSMPVAMPRHLRRPVPWGATSVNRTSSWPTRSDLAGNISVSAGLCRPTAVRRRGRAGPAQGRLQRHGD